MGRAELFENPAAPTASLALLELSGFENIHQHDKAKWSQALMDGVGNYQSDPETSSRAAQASVAIETAIDAILDRHRNEVPPPQYFHQ